MNAALRYRTVAQGRFPAVDAGTPPARVRSAGGGLPGYAPGWRATVGEPARGAIFTLTSEGLVG